MKSNSTYIICLIMFPSVLGFLGGCGRKAGIAPEHKVIWQDDKYETLWIDPQIVLADSLLTLIRSDRIDSILADQTSTTRPGRPSIEIRIYEPFCNVSVGLTDANYRLVHPLLVRNLNRGYYQLTVNVDRFDPPTLPEGQYYLRSEFCDRVQMAAVTIR